MTERARPARRASRPLTRHELEDEPPKEAKKIAASKKAIKYAKNTVQAEIVGEVPNLVDATVLEAFLVAAFEKGRAQEREELSAVTRDREILKSRLEDRLHAGGFGLIGYDNVSADSRGQLDELGL